MLEEIGFFAWNWKFLLLITLTPILYLATSRFEKGQPWAGNKEALRFHRFARALLAFFLVYYCWVFACQALISSGFINSEVDSFSYFDNLLSFVWFLFQVIYIFGGLYLLAFVYPRKAWFEQLKEKPKE